MFLAKSIKKSINKSLAVWAIVLFAAPSVEIARAERIAGLTTDNQVIYFDSAAPATPLGMVSVTGIGAGQSLVGIDVRPVDLALVALGYNAATGQGQVYKVNQGSGTATAISPLISLTGTGFGVDFNPVPNALRIVTDGTGVDNNFRITAGGAGVLNTDSRLNIAGFEDPALGIAAAGYANNVPGGIGGQTTLYVVDAPSGQLYTQGSVNFPPGVSPNTGQLFLVGSLGLGSALGTNIGFDISGMTGTAYFSQLGGSLYTVDLGTGSATAIGALAPGIADITAAPVPEPGTIGLLVMGLGAVGLRRARRRLKQGSGVGGWGSGKDAR